MSYFSGSQQRALYRLYGLGGPPGSVPEKKTEKRFWGGAPPEGLIVTERLLHLWTPPHPKLQKDRCTLLGKTKTSKSHRTPLRTKKAAHIAYIRRERTKGLAISPYWQWLTLQNPFKVY